MPRRLVLRTNGRDSMTLDANKLAELKVLVNASIFESENLDSMVPMKCRTVLDLLDMLAEKDGVIQMLHAIKIQDSKNIDMVLADWRTLRADDDVVVKKLNDLLDDCSQDGRDEQNFVRVSAVRAVVRSIQVSAP